MMVKDYEKEVKIISKQLDASWITLADIIQMFEVHC